MEERTSDTAETFGSQPLPSDVSNQNTEEPEAPQEGSRERPRSEQGGAKDEGGSEGDGRPGGAGERSQATGHPENAG